MSSDERDPPAIGRRELMKLLGASLSLAGAACSQPPAQKILPYVKAPELQPGVPLHYATSMVLDGFATGLLVATHDGRPTKIEGNPEHPASLGGTRAWEQAAILELYDPDRARGIVERGVPMSWSAFVERVASARDQRIAFVLPPESSPLAGEIIARVRERHPRARFAFHAPLARRGPYAAARTLYGRPLEVQYAFDRAKVVLALDADFTSAMPMSIRWARDFAARRRPASPRDEVCRLYAAEPMPSPTGSLADHRLPLPAHRIVELARALVVELAALGRTPARMSEVIDPPPEPRQDPLPRWARAVARDLVSAAGESIVVAGDRQSRDVHVLAHLANAALGNFDRTVTLTEPALFEPEATALDDVARALDAGEIDTLVILERNPAYDAPPELDFARLIGRAKHSVHLSLHHDETSAACRWHLPMAHWLEGWGDARAYDGTLSFVQPLIRPMYRGKTRLEVLAAFAGLPTASGHELLRASLKRRIAGDFEAGWLERIRLGFEPGSASPAVRATMAIDRAGEIANAAASPAPALEVNLEASAVHDGRFANNAWLLELPHPATKLTWDNAAVLSPRTAAAATIEDGQVVAIHAGGRAVRAPALVLPGHADGSVTLALGYGRSGAESLARGVGVSAYPLLPRDGAPFAPATLTATPERRELARTQLHQRQEGRDIALAATLAAYREDPDFTKRQREPMPTMLPVLRSDGEQWAITIDTTICNGCSACVVACQAENNVPVVGKTGVRQGREMHWLRIDRYLDGPDDAPTVVHQPMLCQHCENAPCEYVCPTYATAHSPDGLNEMTYNRCIGTRFCSNNCPYKVRRFNWFDYNHTPDRRALQRNPGVTVRARGVMEKCTYCVQRIRRAEIAARIDRRDIRPGEVTSACAQACPTGAIRFGSLRHGEEAMVKWRNEPRAYAALHDQGTRPRTLYLAKITTPNPEVG